MAHLSDIHVVGERYGFRIESGRAGPQGNGHLSRVFERLDATHQSSPIDIVLLTGDMTDAGRSSEWAEFYERLADYPAIADRMLILPGNHDVNVVDRANPARLELRRVPANSCGRCGCCLQWRVFRVIVLMFLTGRKIVWARPWLRRWPPPIRHSVLRGRRPIWQFG